MGRSLRRNTLLNHNACIISVTASLCILTDCISILPSRILSIFVGSLLEIDSFVQNIDRVVHAMISVADARFIKLNE